MESVHPVVTHTYECMVLKSWWVGTVIVLWVEEKKGLYFCFILREGEKIDSKNHATPTLIADPEERDLPMPFASWYRN